MNGLLFQSADPPARSHPARADIACFVGLVGRRLSVPAGRARLERALNQLGWHGPALPTGARLLPPDVQPSGDTSTSFARWLQARGWRPDANAVAALDLFRRAAALVVGEAPVQWWAGNGWLAPFSRRAATDLLELIDVPVPIETWDALDGLFAWEARPLAAERTAHSHLGAAVRRFFLEGGRRCYIVRVDDPRSPFIDEGARAALRARIFPDLPSPTPAERSTWRGIGHLLGLEDVSFLCVPDLPELCSTEVGPIPLESDAEGPETFVECGARTMPATASTLRAFAAPGCDERGFGGWAAFVKRVGTLLQRECACVQFIASLPLPAGEGRLRALPELAGLGLDARRREVARRVAAGRAAQREHAGSIGSRWVQLAYPWLRTRESGQLPGAVEPPDAMLVGLLAAQALTSGAWRSAAFRPAPRVVELEPVLSVDDLRQEMPSEDTGIGGPLGVVPAFRPAGVARSMVERVSVFVPTPRGFQLLSDVTTDDDEAYRPAHVHRLFSSVVRAARLVGQDSVFANSGEALWKRLRSALERLLLGLWAEGALEGASAAAAFDVRCDRSTMTQANIDAGQAIVRVSFTPAHAIERITVVFSVADGGDVSLLGSSVNEAAEAMP